MNSGVAPEACRHVDTGCGGRPLLARIFREIGSYYAEIASIDVAAGVLRRLAEGGAKAAERPLLYRRRDSLAPGLRAVPVNPYLVFYRLEGELVEVVRVLHQQRDLVAIFRSVEDLN